MTEVHLLAALVTGARAVLEHRVRSPDPEDAIAVEHFVAADDLEVLVLALRDEHAIEGIAMGTRQAAGALGVLQGDRQVLEPLAEDVTGDVVSELLSARQLAD